MVLGWSCVWDDGEEMYFSLEGLSQCVTALSVQTSYQFSLFLALVDVHGVKFNHIGTGKGSGCHFSCVIKSDQDFHISISIWFHEFSRWIVVLEKVICCDWPNGQSTCALRVWDGDALNRNIDCYCKHLFSFMQIWKMDMGSWFVINNSISLFCKKVGLTLFVR